MVVLLLVALVQVLVLVLILILILIITIMSSCVLCAGSLELQPVEGNPQRGVWKACCWRMAEEVRSHKDASVVFKSWQKCKKC